MSHVPPPAPSSLQKIRLSSDEANQLNGIRNWRADGDGCDGLHLMQCRGGGLKGLTVQTVGSETGEDLSDRILIAENRCAALFVSPVSPETRLGTAACASVGARYRFTRPGRGRPSRASPSSLQKIRLSSDGDNPLNGIRNWWADGDGCDGLHLDAGVVQRLKGLTVCTVGSEPW